MLVVPGFSGQLKPWFSWLFNAVVSAEKYDTAQVRALDVVGMFKLHDAFQVWVGRFVVPFDRFNLTGPYRNLIWTFPGFYNGRPQIGADGDPYGRSSGAAVWGSVDRGLLKYYAMAYQLENVQLSPRFAARVSVGLPGGEPGYFMSSTYGGERTALSVGVGAQYQNDGRRTAPTDPAMQPNVLGDLWAVTADAFGEKKFEAVGTFTADVAFYHYDEHRPLRDGYFATLGYQFPARIGVGDVQLGVRWQQAFAGSSFPNQPDLKGFDGTVSYFMDGFKLRFAANYARQWLGPGAIANAISLGLQFGYP